MKKLKSILQFENENKNLLDGSEMNSITGGLIDLAKTSNRINGSTGSEEPEGDTDCWTELYDDNGYTIMYVISY